MARGGVASLARPGGNLTGFSIQVGGLMPKRLELLSELAPHAGVIALLVNPNKICSAGRSHSATRFEAGSRRVIVHLSAAGLRK
jgi:putative ABC transport system substrate-binding protein